MAVLMESHPLASVRRPPPARLVLQLLRVQQVTPEYGSQAAAAAYVLAVRKGDDVEFDRAVIARVQYSVLAVEAFSSILLDPSKEAAVQLAGDCNCCVHSQKIMWCPHAKVRAYVTFPPDAIVVMVAR